MPPPQNVIDYLERDFLTAIRYDLVSVVRFHEKNKGGFHSIPREVFCYIDYIATLRYGLPSSSKNAIRFIEQYFGAINIRYRWFGKLLYEMWRHGTVHEFDPKVLKHSKRKYCIGWLTNNDSKPKNRACHLECFKKHGTSEMYVLTVNLFQLVDDLVQAIQANIAELKRNKHRREEVQSTYKEISRPLSVQELPKKNKSLKRKLALQITKAVKVQRWEVDKKGTVIKGNV